MAIIFHKNAHKCPTGIFYSISSVKGPGVGIIHYHIPLVYRNRKPQEKYAQNGPRFPESGTGGHVLHDDLSAAG